MLFDYCVNTEEGRDAYFTDCQSTVVVKGELLSGVNDRPRHSGTRHCKKINSNSFLVVAFLIAVLKCLFIFQKKSKTTISIITI